MKVRPCTLGQANRLVDALHRHHDPVQGHRFSIALYDDEDCLRGVAIVGRPVAPKTEQYQVAEVLRICTDGTRNACSKLLGACARIAKEMGFSSIQTFTLDSEPGTSLRAAGWQMVHVTSGGTRHRPSRSRQNEKHPTTPKHKWEKRFQ